MSAPTTISPQLRTYLQKLKSADFEKNIPYMYVDTVGKVTVGVGHNLTDNGDMMKLSFVVQRFERHAVLGGDRGIPIASNKVIGRSASEAEIQNDYDFLAKHPKLGMFAPEQLRQYTTLELSAEAIDALFSADLVVAVAQCRREFGDDEFAKFPIACQAALIDIAFNCGNFNSFKGHLVPAIKGQGHHVNQSMADRWKTAASHSRRGKVSAARNNCVMAWFIEGAATFSTKTQEPSISVQKP